MTTLKIGTVLIANEDSFLKSSGKQFLIKGKEYPITVVQKKHIEIKSESHDIHEFTIGQLENYFTIKRYTLTDLKEKKIAVRIAKKDNFIKICNLLGYIPNFGDYSFIEYHGVDEDNEFVWLNDEDLEGRILLKSIDEIDLEKESKTCKCCFQ